MPGVYSITYWSNPSQNTDGVGKLVSTDWSSLKQSSLWCRTTLLLCFTLGPGHAAANPGPIAWNRHHPHLCPAARTWLRWARSCSGGLNRWVHVKLRWFLGQTVSFRIILVLLQLRWKHLTNCEEHSFVFLTPVHTDEIACQLHALTLQIEGKLIIFDPTLLNQTMDCFTCTQLIFLMHSTPSSSGFFSLTHGRCSLATNLIWGSKRCIEWHISKRSNSSNSFRAFSSIQTKRGGMLGRESEHSFTRYATVLWVDSFGVTSSSVEANCISFSFLSWSKILKGLGTWGTSFKISIKAAGQTKQGS